MKPYVICHMMPAVDGIHDRKDFLPVKISFREVSTFPNGVVWLRYNVNSIN